MGMLYGIAGMSALIAAYWRDETYTYDDGKWLGAATMDTMMLSAESSW